MQAHTVLILTAGLAQKSAPNALDRMIGELLRRRKTPYILLGTDGDAVLEQCSRVEDCEMIFDPNHDPSNDELFSSVKAGLFATNAAAFILRLDRPLPADSVWTQLETKLRLDENKKTDIYVADNDPSGLVLVTAQGGKRLKERAADSRWPVAEDIACDLVSGFDSRSVAGSI